MDSTLPDHERAPLRLLWCSWCVLLADLERMVSTIRFGVTAARQPLELLGLGSNPGSGASLANCRKDTDCSPQRESLYSIRMIAVPPRNVNLGLTPGCSAPLPPARGDPSKKDLHAAWTAHYLRAIPQ